MIEQLKAAELSKDQTTRLYAEYLRTAIEMGACVPSTSLSSDQTEPLMVINRIEVFFDPNN